MTDTLRMRRDRTALWGKRLIRVATVRNGDESIEEHSMGYTSYVYWYVGNGQIRFQTPAERTCPGCSSYIPDYHATATATGLEIRNAAAPGSWVWEFRRIE